MDFKNVQNYIVAHPKGVSNTVMLALVFSVITWIMLTKPAYDIMKTPSGDEKKDRQAKLIWGGSTISTLALVGILVSALMGQKKA